MTTISFNYDPYARPTAPSNLKAEGDASKKKKEKKVYAAPDVVKQEDIVAWTKPLDQIGGALELTDQDLNDMEPILVGSESVEGFSGDLHLAGGVFKVSKPDGSNKIKITKENVADFARFKQKDKTDDSSSVLSSEAPPTPGGAGKEAKKSVPPHKLEMKYDVASDKDGSSSSSGSSEEEKKQEEKSSGSEAEEVEKEEGHTGSQVAKETHEEEGGVKSESSSGSDDQKEAGEEKEKEKESQKEKEQQPVCPPGQELNGGGGNTASDVPVSCVLCQPGTANPHAGGTCAKCPAGTFAALPGRVECSACPTSTYSAEEGATACNTCGIGRYGAGNGATEAEHCKDCPAGHACPLEATYFPVKCPPSATSNNGVTCEKCLPFHTPTKDGGCRMPRALEFLLAGGGVLLVVGAAGLAWRFCHVESRMRSLDGETNYQHWGTI